MKKIFAYIAIAALALAGASAKDSVVALRSGAALYETKDAQTVKYATDITAGTLLDARSSDTVIKNLYTKATTYENVKFYAVSYNKKEYFIQIRDSAVVNSADNVAVVAENSVLFTKPHYATFRNAWLEPGTIVACDNNTYSEWTEITFYDTDDGVRRTRYVLDSTLATKANDVKAIQLLEKARALKDEGLKKDFLDNAVKATSAGSEKIAMYVKAEVNAILGINVAEDEPGSLFSDDDIVQVDPFPAHISTADGSKVNLRSAPGTAGERIGQLENGTAVTCSLKTESKETIEGINAEWIYVTAELGGDIFEGWVFGGYLDER
ncbi:MAG: SH3 domain-containing protein [Treponema sp.]|nr:SH3 domain-containing protein [Treponema sp.]